MKEAELPPLPKGELFLLLSFARIVTQLEKNPDLSPREAIEIIKQEYREVFGKPKA